MTAVVSFGGAVWSIVFIVAGIAAFLVAASFGGDW